MKSQLVFLNLFFLCILTSCAPTINVDNSSKTSANGWEENRSTIGLIITIGGVLLSSSGVLGKPRLERLERFGRKTRKRTKFTIFFYSSMPVIGKFFLYVVIFFYLGIIIALFIPSASRSELMQIMDKGGLPAIISFVISLLISALQILTVLYLLVKHKSPMKAQQAIKEKASSFIAKNLESYKTMPYLMALFPLVPLFLMLYLYSIFTVWYFWVAQVIYASIFSLVVYLFLLPYKLLEIFRIKSKFRGSMAAVGVVLSILGAILSSQK